MNTKKISSQVKTIQTKQDIPKQWKKILRESRGRMDEDISTTRCKGSKRIFYQNMGAGVHDRKVEWLNNMDKELLRFEESPNTKIHFHSITATLKGVPNWKMPDHSDPKRPQIGTALNNYGLITFLPIMRKILRVQIK